MQQLQEKSVVLVIFYAIITAGIYVPVWLINRADAFNALNSKQKVSKPLFIGILILAIISVIMLVPYVILEGTSTGAVVDTVQSIIDIVAGIFVIVIAFQLKRIMSEHYKIEMSGVATFFFTILYIQYKINQVVNTKPDSVIL